MPAAAPTPAAPQGNGASPAANGKAAPPQDTLATGQTVRYIPTLQGIQALVSKKKCILNGRGKHNNYVGLAARGATPNSAARLVAVATTAEVLVFDSQMCAGLAAHLMPFLSDASVVKLTHGLSASPLPPFVASVNACDKRLPIAGVVDLQLVAELRAKTAPEAKLFDVLRALDASILARPAAEVAREGAINAAMLRAKAVTTQVIMAVASDAAWLHRAGRTLVPELRAAGLARFVKLSEWRAAFNLQHPGERAVAFSPQNVMVSREAAMPDPSQVAKDTALTVECELVDLVQVLPANLASAFGHNQASKLVMLTNEKGPGVGKDGMVLLDHLNDIVLDIGRAPIVWIRGKRYSFGDAGRVVVQEDLDYVVGSVGEFGGDNRAGIDRKLHRVSCMRHRADQSVIGLTLRVGRSVTGNVTLLLDLLLGTEKSILFLGPPCTGKTTIVREAARILGERSNVCVVDTSNEIAGDGGVPHHSIGHARRMMVPSLAQQWAVMVECVQNHSIDTMLVDEIGRSREVEAARTVKQRGVRLLASAHGDLRGLIKNKELRGLIGGVEKVTVGDDVAREAARKRKRPGEDGNRIHKIIAQRGGDPTFEVIVEVSSTNLHEWTVTLDSSEAVDRILDGAEYDVEIRTRDASGDNIRVRNGVA